MRSTKSTHIQTQAVKGTSSTVPTVGSKSRAKTDELLPQNSSSFSSSYSSSSPEAYSESKSNSASPSILSKAESGLSSNIPLASISSKRALRSAKGAVKEAKSEAKSEPSSKKSANAEEVLAAKKTSTKDLSSKAVTAKDATAKVSSAKATKSADTKEGAYKGSSTKAGSVKSGSAKNGSSKSSSSKSSASKKATSSKRKSKAKDALKELALQYQIVDADENTKPLDDDLAFEEAMLNEALKREELAYNDINFNPSADLENRAKAKGVAGAVSKSNADGSGDCGLAKRHDDRDVALDEADDLSGEVSSKSISGAAKHELNGYEVVEPVSRAVKAHEAKANILIIDDDKQLLKVLKRKFSNQGYTTFEALNIKQGQITAGSCKPDIILLNVQIEGALELIENIRSYSLVPIIALSSDASEDAKVKILDLGCDDYVVKPFGSPELLARARARLRRRSVPRDGYNSATLFHMGNVQFDLSSSVVTKNMEIIHLTKMEKRLLQLLIANNGRVLSTDFITKEVWGPNTDQTQNLRIFIYSLRSKLEDDPRNPAYILTVTGEGYRLRTDWPIWWAQIKRPAVSWSFILIVVKNL